MMTMCKSKLLEYFIKHAWMGILYQNSISNTSGKNTQPLTSRDISKNVGCLSLFPHMLIGTLF